MLALSNKNIIQIGCLPVFGTGSLKFNFWLPPHLNVSWYVYMNCSRDKCLLTNSTNETELMDEGWVLHNCTSYGCMEIYPRSESLQKFIGLMLLVASICVLKILAFVLIFYYCRRIKLAKNGDTPAGLPQNGDSATGPLKTEDADENDPTSKVKRNEKQPNAGDTNNSADKQNRPYTDAQSQSLLDDAPVSNQEEPNKSSKVWTPPSKTTTPNAAVGDGPMVFGVHVDKGLRPSSKCGQSQSRKATRKIHNRRSGIPTLVSKRSRRGASESTKPQLNIKIDEVHTEGLLMQLEGDFYPVPSAKGLFPSAHLEKSPQWQKLPEKDPKSYISLDDDELAQFLAGV